MSTTETTSTVKAGWLKDKNGDNFAPKTLVSQIQENNGVMLEDRLQSIEKSLDDITYTYGTDDLTAGTTQLATGKLHFVYE